MAIAGLIIGMLGLAVYSTFNAEHGIRAVMVHPSISTYAPSFTVVFTDLRCDILDWKIHSVLCMKRPGIQVDTH
ncbi:hypothetical protein EDD18DRAFT_1127882 [Armillaria luteobubalina]|uniref:Uncharacterized protein n=1 Tax=Armillaria luteobubalina TaxID=153913 RepID=A0AA39V4D5_9AGAR|nr:hypothetical protein EDD18DRAFT_1127882 [Armillaria luteobubalina]